MLRIQLKKAWKNVYVSQKKLDFSFKNHDFVKSILSRNYSRIVVMRLLGGSQGASLTKYTKEIDPVREKHIAVVLLSRLGDSIGEKLTSFEGGLSKEATYTFFWAFFNRENSWAA